MSNPLRPRIQARRSNERPHVLVVSDDPALTSFLVDGLPLGGFWVSVIASGLQALEVFRLRQFDLLAIDADLQGFDALELLRRLRGVSLLDSEGHGPRTTAPAVVFISTSSSDEYQNPALGVEAILEAPVELDEVVRSLHEVFAKWRYSNPDSTLADSANLAF